MSLLLIANCSDGEEESGEGDHDGEDGADDEDS